MVSLALVAVGSVSASACAALWGFEPGESAAPPPATAQAGGGSGGAGEGGSGAVGGTGGSAGSGGEPFVQHQEGSIELHWDFGAATELWNVDQYFCIEQLGGNAQWVQRWQWTGKTYGGYFALQTDGARFDGTQGRTLVFSLAHATAARAAPCQPFVGEEPGYACRLPYDFQVDRCYRLRLWRLETDADGQWWGCWIYDRSTGDEVAMGGLRVALDDFTVAPPPVNVVEYVGQAVECDSVPIATGLVGAPGGNTTGDDLYEFDASFVDYAQAACVGGGVEGADLGWRSGVSVTLGGP